MTLAALAGGVLVIGGAWWAYVALTAMPPPDVQVADSDEVAEFLGSKRGFARLSIDEREEYVAKAFDRFASDPDDRVAFHRSLRRMSPSQRDVFLNGFLEVAKTRFVEKAREYNRAKSGHAKRRFVDNVIRDLETLRGHLVGGPGGVANGPNLGNPFAEDVPKGGDAIAHRVWSLTTPREREESKELLEDMDARINELRDPQERRRFDSAGT